MGMMGNGKCELSANLKGSGSVLDIMEMGRAAFCIMYLESVVAQCLSS